ncbi:hypothetical protein ScPMuIL_002971 [Solemya velum]
MVDKQKSQPRKNHSMSGAGLAVPRKNTHTKNFNQSIGNGNAIMEETTESKVPSRIFDNEIEKLIIRPDALSELRKTLCKPRWKVDQMREVYVRKLKPLEMNRKQTVSVLRPVQYGMTVSKPVFLGSKHSITGGPCANRCLDATENKPLKVYKRDGYPFRIDTMKPVILNRRKNSHRRHRAFNTKKAMSAWKSQIEDREKQQQRLSSKLSRPVDHLLMARGSVYNHTQSEKQMLAQALYALENVIGGQAQALLYMWNQQERIGDDVTGLHLSYTKTEKKGPQTLKISGTPSAALLKNVQIRLNGGEHTWRNSQCLKKRKEELSEILGTLYPHIPLATGLVVTGKTCSRPQIVIMQAQSDIGIVETATDTIHIDRIPSGPALRINGAPALWAGTNHKVKGCVGLHVAVVFDGAVRKQLVQYLDIFNCGSTVVHYDWMKIRNRNLFGLKHPQNQKFYFPSEAGVICPGQKIKLLVIMKSQESGLFVERWKLQTRPVLLGGAGITITLKGFIHPLVDYHQVWSKMEESLIHKQAESAVRQIMASLLLVACREKTETYVSVPTVLSVNDAFSSINLGLHYHSAVVCDLQQVYGEASSCLDVKSRWDLSVIHLKEMLCKLEDQDEKEHYLEHLSYATMQLSYQPQIPVNPPVTSQKYNIVYNCLEKAVTDFCLQAFALAQQISTEMEVVAKEEPKDFSNVADDVVEQMKKKKTQRRKSVTVNKLKAKESEQKPMKLPPRSTSTAQKNKEMWRHAMYSVIKASQTVILKDKLREKLYLQTYMLLQDTVEGISIALQGVDEV